MEFWRGVGEDVVLGLGEGCGVYEGVAPGAAVDVNYENAVGVVGGGSSGDVDGERVKAGGVGVGDVGLIERVVGCAGWCSRCHGWKICFFFSGSGLFGLLV